MRRWLMGALVLGACSQGGDPIGAEDPQQTEVVDGVAFSAQARVMESFPVQIQPVLSVRNTGSGAAEVVFPDGCVALLQVYRTAARTGAPVWDQSRTVGCTMALVPAKLAAGETREFRGPTVSAAEILGDSLSAGTYHFSVVTRPDRTGRVALAAGSASLAK